MKNFYYSNFLLTNQLDNKFKNLIFIYLLNRFINWENLNNKEIFELHTLNFHRFKCLLPIWHFFFLPIWYQSLYHLFPRHSLHRLSPHVASPSSWLKEWKTETSKNACNVAWKFKLSSHGSPCNGCLLIIPRGK